MARSTHSKPADGSRSSGAAFAKTIELDKDHRSKGRSLKSLRYLWPYIAKYKGWLVLFLLFLGLSAAATLILPMIMKIITDCGFGDNPGAVALCQTVNVDGAADLGFYFKLAMVFMVLYAGFASLRFLFITALGQRVIADIRSAVYSKLLYLSPEYFETVRTGEVLSRLTTDTTLVETVVTGSISFALRSVVTIIGSVILMFFVSWKLALMVLCIGPAIIIPAIVLGQRIRILSRQGQDDLAEASARAGEALTNIQTVQAYTREQTEDAFFGDAIEQTYRVQFRRIRMQSFLTWIIFVIALCGMTGILWFGADSVNKGTMSGGDIVAFAAYAFFAVSGAGALTETWTNLLRAAGASERLVEILREEPSITAPKMPKLPHDSSIHFDDVSFVYPSRPEQSVLSGVSFDLKPGETVALVGPSGAGKSTLFQLLLRFYDVTSGSVRIGDTALTDMDPEALRQQFAIVQQNTPLFSGSAMDNIRYGREGASDAEVIAAAKAAYAHDFILALPEGYDTDLGERATTLSGGQRQRLAIARAILRDAPILLLDEATSALDAESEAAVQKAFEDISKDRTTLVIAHRLATVKSADRIIVMDEGKIVATGTHTTLSKQDGLYKRLADLQFTTQG